MSNRIIDFPGLRRVAEVEQEIDVARRAARIRLLASGVASMYTSNVVELSDNAHCRLVANLEQLFFSTYSRERDGT